MSKETKTFLSAFLDYQDYAKARHKKQGFETHIRNFKLHILPYFKDVNDLNQLQTKDIIDWQNTILEKDYSNSFNSNLFYTLSSFIEYCVLCGYMDKNVIREVKNFKKKIENKDYKVYNIWQFRWFRLHLDNYIHKQFFNFMFFYGTRPSETMAIRFCDIEVFLIHIQNNIERRGNRALDTPKNQSSIRTLRMSILTKIRIWKLKHIYLKSYGTFSDNYFVFGGQKPLSTSTIDRHKKKACKKAHLFEITQHQFRHSYATRMIHKNKAIDIVSRSMGHSKVSTTCDVYLHQEKRMTSIHFPRFFL